MTTTQAITTAEQFLHAPDLGRCELVRGELIMMSPSGFEHARVVMAITFSVASYIKQRPLGVLTGAEGGFLIAHDPDTVRAPDLGFILRERVPAEPVRGFFPGAPDLAVEVLSPDDRASEVLAKVRDWLQAGCRLVWVVDPRTRTVSVYRDSGQVLALREPDALGGEDLLPGFSVPLAEIFAPCGAAEK